MALEIKPVDSVKPGADERFYFIAFRQLEKYDNLKFHWKTTFIHMLTVNKMYFQRMICAC